MRAMVIDDSRAMRMILGKILRECGFQTSDAVHGRDGLEKLEAGGPPDLILVDWNMPEMNGIEFLRALRADNRYDGVRVMMVTTETAVTQVQAALEAGANEF